MGHNGQPVGSRSCTSEVAHQEIAFEVPRTICDRPPWALVVA